MRVWSSHDGNSETDMRVRNTAADTAVLSLHVICAAGFGIQQLWPGESKTRLQGAEGAGLGSFEPSGDHTMTFKESLDALLHGIRWLVLIPKSVLSVFSKQNDLDTMADIVQNARHFRVTSRYIQLIMNVSRTFKSSGTSRRSRCILASMTM